MEKLDDLPPEIRRECLRSSYKICGREALLPKSLPIPLCYNPLDTPQTRGGLTDVWKGEYKGQEVAAKALRVYKTGDPNVTRKVGGVPPIMFSSELTVSHAVVLQGGRDVEDTSSPERVATVRRDDVRGSASVRDGIGVDEEREHQPVSGVCGRRSVEARMSFVWGRYLHLVLTVT